MLPGGPFHGRWLDSGTHGLASRIGESQPRRELPGLLRSGDNLRTDVGEDELCPAEHDERRFRIHGAPRQIDETLARGALDERPSNIWSERRGDYGRVKCPDRGRRVAGVQIDDVIRLVATLNPDVNVVVAREGSIGGAAPAREVVSFDSDPHSSILAAGEDRRRLADFARAGRIVLMKEPLGMPANLLDAASQEGRSDWLRNLPEVVAVVERIWSVRVDEPFQPGGQTAWVAPASGTDHDLVVKIAWRHPEAAHEADGLRIWDGNGTVRLHAVEEIDGSTLALLLERCRPGTTLETLPEPEQDLIIAGLLHRLWRQPPADGPFRPLQSMCDLWAAQFEENAARTTLLDSDLARAGIALFRELPSSGTDETLLCTDLHAGNVLAAEREPWLVVDPKPYRGDPTYDALQHMLNCESRLLADPRGLVRRMAGLLDLDPDRLGLWLFARCVQESPDWPTLAQVARTIAPD